MAVTRAEIGDLFWRPPIHGGLQGRRHDCVIAHPGVDAPQIAAGVDGARVIERKRVEQFRLDEAVHGNA
jgi:hypothetical protein